MKHLTIKHLALAVLALASAPMAASAEPAASDYKVQAQYALGGSGKWDYLKLDAAARRLYIARLDRVMVMDVDKGTLVGEVPGAIGAHGVALVPTLHRGYVSNGHGDSLTPFDLQTLKPLAVIPVSGKDPDALLFDQASSHLWAFNGHSNSASVIDPTAGKEIGRVELSGNPEFAVSDGQGLIYVNLEDKGQIAQIDARKQKVLATWSLGTCEGPTGLALDAARHRLFSVCANHQMAITDAVDGHHVATLPIGDHPDAAGYDPSAQMAFSSNGDGTLTVVHQNDADHYTVVTNVATAKGARTMAIDESTHKIFLAAPAVSPPNQATGAAGQFGVLVVGTP